MKKRIITGMAIIFSMAITSNAAASLFTNGGFETGDTTGWTVTGDGEGSGAGLVEIIDNTATMDFQNIDIDPYNGSYMARIGDVYGDYDWTRLSQTGYISQEDIDNGANLYVNWGAVLVDPINNPHGDLNTPYFKIDLSVNGVSIDSFERNATDHNGAVMAGNYGASTGGEMWYYSGQWSYDLSSFSVNDAVTLDLLVDDCDWGGHGGYAFLDGIGTVQPPGPSPVPVPAAVWLLGSGLAGLAGIKRKQRNG